jgi:Na+-translocating ferredoxin:NAD+ oxidoreductase RnfD subunit
MLLLSGAWQWLKADPRHGQIATLASLLVYGLGWLDFDLTLLQAAVTLSAALGVQRLADHWTGRPVVSGAKSALISALSLCLLLRTDALWLAAVAAAIAVGSKFLIRIRDKHVFNPTNLALVVLLLTTDAAWVSPGQWGTHAIFAFGMACAGLLVVHRATRSDVTIAFIASYATLVFARSIWLGEPLAIPLHRLESGAFLLFSFFMISDPRTTPDSRTGRVLFAALVAFGAAYVQFRLFRTNGLLWALAAASPLVPLIDLARPAGRFFWPDGHRPSGRLPGRFTMVRRIALVMAGLVGLAASAGSAEAFCGFYVARADTKLYNKASQVVLVRDGDRTVITMANDFRGDPREFAMVIPVPTSIARDQIHVADKAVIAHLDAFTAPRLVEYYDGDPCARYERRFDALPMAAAASGAREADRARSLGVTIEAQYTVGEYDILILSAAESTGLEQWLKENGYRIPPGASAVLGSYIKQNMRFFVARVNLEEQAKLGYATLRPIQVAYESPKFMLPIRLGTVNADGEQELFIYTLTRKGRVETTNYRTVRLQTDVEIPAYVKDPREFARMYRAMFDQHVSREQMRAVFLEYAWDMAWCDPCAADPLTPDELGQLGVFWVERGSRGPAAPWRPQPVASAQDVFVTRLHVRYDQAHFPEDLVFQETGDRTNFQGRYVLRHAWTGPARCAEAEAYRRELPRRREREAQSLASLTGWSIDEIRRRMGLDVARPQGEAAAELPWWRRIWAR